MKTLIKILCLSSIIFTQAQIWTENNYVDEFGDRTSKKYIFAKIIDGTFSNSAVTNRVLHSKILVDVFDISIELREYSGSSLVKGRDKPYSVKIKNNKRTYTFEGTLKADTDRIHFSKRNERTIKDILKNGGKISFYIEEIDTYSVPSKYRFIIKDCSKFLTAYNDAFKATDTPKLSQETINLLYKDLENINNCSDIENCKWNDVRVEYNIEKSHIKIKITSLFQTDNFDYQWYINKIETFQKIHLNEYDMAVEFYNELSTRKKIQWILSK